jgi:hypothetical protein
MADQNRNKKAAQSGRLRWITYRFFRTFAERDGSFQNS